MTADLSDEVELLGAHPLAFQQTSVGNGRAGLTGNDRKQPDMFVRKRTGQVALNRNRADHICPGQEWDEHRTGWHIRADVAGTRGERIGLGSKVVHQERLAGAAHPSHNAFAFTQIKGRRWLADAVHLPEFNRIVMVLKQTQLKCGCVYDGAGLLENQLAQPVHLQCGARDGATGFRQSGEFGHALLQRAARSQAAAQNERHRQQGQTADEDEQHVR